MVLVKKIFPFVLILGLISIVIYNVFRLDSQLFTKTTINGQTLYVFDLHTYYENLKSVAITDALDFQTIIPTRTWKTTNANMLQQEFWNTFINDVAYVFDWIYFPVNFILYIVRWICWALVGFMALLGWPNVVKEIHGGYTEYTSTLMTILHWITQNLFINYI